MVNILMSNLGIGLDNSRGKQLKTHDQVLSMVGPGGLEPPTRPL
jgi:hypothetical protein